MSLRFTAIIGLIVVALLAAGCANQTRTGQQPSPAGDDKIVVAGSGNNVFVMGKVAAAYTAKTGVAVEVPGTIGSSGAINAVKAGTLELGLISRPLTPAEQADGLVQLPYGRVPVVFAANASVTDTNLTTGELLDIIRGEKTAWSDGAKIIVHVREETDSANMLLYSKIPGYKDALYDAYKNNRWRILYRDPDMAGALSATNGSFGIASPSDLVQYRGLKALALDGVPPTADNVRTGKYPLVKELSFVCRAGRSDRAERFLAFVFSPEGRQLLNQWGAVPPER